MICKNKNREEDLKLLVDLGEGYSPGCEFQIEFFSGKLGRPTYVCAGDGNSKYTNCLKVDGRHVLCLLDNHNLALGRIDYKITLRVPDDQMPDGNMRVVTNGVAKFIDPETGEEYCICLTNGASDSMPASAIHVTLLDNLIKGNAATIDEVTIVSVGPDEDPLVQNLGDEHHARLHFAIPRGKDGYTPQKGVDYFDGKDADIAAAESATAAANNAARSASDAANAAYEAKRQAEQATRDASAAAGLANSAAAEVNGAAGRAEDAVDAANKAIETIYDENNIVSDDVDKELEDIEQAAIARAIKAAEDAERATQEANKVSDTVNQLAIKVGELEQGGSMGELKREIEIIKHGFYDNPDAPAPDEPEDNPSDSDDSSGGDDIQDEPQEQLEWVHPQNNQTASGTTIGGKITISNFSGYGYVKIPVKNGDKFFICGTGGTSGRLVAFTDENDTLVLKDPNAASERNYTIITAPQDGYLYSTNKFESTPNPYVRKPAYYKDKVVGRHEIANNSSYTSGNSVGATLNGIATNSSFRCLIIPVFAGMKATVYTYGGSNGRAYQLTDMDRKIVKVAPSGANNLSAPAVVEIEQDGLLAINADNSKLTDGFNPYVIIENPNSGEGGGSGEDTPTPDVPEEPTDDNRELCLDVLNEKFEWLKSVINSGNIGSGGSSSGSSSSSEKKELKILCIGNSFADNMTGYINDLCQNLDVTKLVTIYKYNTGSSSLSNWWTRYINDNSYTAANVCGSTMNVGTTLKQGFACDWDIVVLQQLSSKTGDYSSFEPYLTNLIAHIKKLCTNPSVKIAWQMTWPRTSTWTGASAPIGVSGFGEITNAVKSMMDSGVSIDYIIPSGTAIMNARGNATLNNDNELSSDGQHLASGVGVYIASCAMYQTLIKDFVGKPLTASTLSKSPNIGTGATAVDDTNRELCHMAVLFACASPYKISTLV